MILETASSGTTALVDLHCHILPGIDDGAKSTEEAVAMARLAAADGVGAIVATPHVFRDGHARQPLEVIERKVDELNGILKANAVPVEILPGAEVHISHNLISEIRAHRERLLLNRSSYIFVEFPPDHIFSTAKDLIFELLSEGITPIVAHPERNTEFRRNPGLLHDLVAMGALSQANAGSFEGRYGRSACESVRRFLTLNLIHFIASDGHGCGGDTGPWLTASLLHSEPLVGRERALALIRENPSAVIKNKPLPSLPPPLLPKIKGPSFKIRIPKMLRPGR